MLGSPKKGKTVTCESCGFATSSLDIDRQCSNCFACTGCETYLCPACGNEIIVKPIRKMTKGSEPSLPV